MLLFFQPLATWATAGTAVPFPIPYSGVVIRLLPGGFLLVDEDDVLVGAVGATGSVHGLDEAPTNVYGTQPKIKINEFTA